MKTVPANEIIPTLYRKKIANWQGYPLGAEVISTALAGVPQFLNLTISFHEDYSRRGVPWPGAENYRVVLVSYRKIFNSPPAEKPALELDWRERNWQIDVYPVPRIRRHHIKSLLVSEALPQVHGWLLKNAANRMGRQNISFSFSERTQKLTVEEDSKLEPLLV